MRFVVGHGRWANSINERLWSRIDKQGPDECWLWHGSKNPNGYGVISINGKQTTAHRVVYMLTIGPVPSDMVVCHTCDTPACCNPFHLWIGTDADNAADKIAKGREGHPINIGAKNPNVKLTESDVIAIRNAHSTGETLTNLARQYNVQRPAIWKIVRRISWSHIP